MLDDAAEPINVPWSEILRRAQKMPLLWVWSQEDGHLTGPITAALRAVWEKRMFQQPVDGTIHVSPTQCLVQCRSGPLVPALAPLFHFENCDVLLGELYRANRRLFDTESRALRRFRDATFALGRFAHILCLAEFGALAERDARGLWYQSYQRGWPTSPPTLLEQEDPAVGLMVSAALSRDWFFGLPYTESAAWQAVPELARPHVTLEWSPEDRPLTSGGADPGYGWSGNERSFSGKGGAMKSRDAIVMAAREMLQDEERGGADGASFAGRVASHAVGLEDPADITDASLNALWNFADSYFDARAHNFQDLDGVPWSEARSLLLDAVEHAERGEPITEPRMRRYLFPSRRRQL